MKTELPYILDFYDKDVSQKISQKYGYSILDSYRKFLYSETYRMLSNPKLEMWDFSPDAFGKASKLQAIHGTRFI